jgi:hypothetical protein
LGRGKRVRGFVTRQFNRFARSERVTDERLCEAIGRAEGGLIDADLGGGLIKQRVARPGQGRSGGFRTVIAYRRLGRAVFLHGFAKNERDNIDADDLARLKKLAAIYLGATMNELEAWCEEGELKEVMCDGEEVSKPDR